MSWYMTVLKRYAEFEGRASRSEFWYFTLFNIIAFVVAGILDGVLAGLFGGMPVLTVIYALGTLIPSIAVAIRRLHDTGRSGWWYLLGLVPLLGLVLIVFFVFDSQPGENQYGANPKGVTA